MRPRHMLVRCTALAAVSMLCVAAHAQNTIASVNPTSIPAGVAGINLTITGTLPAFSASTTGVCFYTGFGSTAPIIPTAGATVVVSVPATTIQQVPPGQFSGGTFSAKLYTASATTACNGAGNTSNIVTVPLVLPTVSSFAAASVPQKNPNTGVQPPPYAIHFAGSNFISTMTAAYTWTGGSGSGAVTYSSIGSVTAKLSTFIPAGVTSTSVTLCNHAPTFDYCVAPQTITLTALTNSTGTLAAAPNPATALQSVALTATFGPAGAVGGAIGAPTGTVTFSNGATSLGSSTLVLDKTSTLSQSATKNVSAAPPLGMRMVDLNGDGIPDTIFVDGNGKVHVILGTTPIGNFQAESTYTDPNCTSLNSFDVGDINQDGYPDLVIDCTNAVGGNLADIMFNAGDGSFGAATTIPGVYAGQVLLRDTNRDTFLDLIVEGQLAIACPGPCPVGFAVYRGNGTGTFTLTTSVPTTSTPGTQLFVIDLDGDGYVDILTLNNGSQVTNSIDIYRSVSGSSYGTLSGGVYVPSLSIPLAAYPATYSQIFSADFNNDTVPDLGVIYTSGSGVTTALQNTTPGNPISFAAPTTFSTAAAGVSASTGDFTSDGNIDILVATSTGVQVYDGNGKGAFFTNYGSLNATPGGTIARAVASDLNGDGDADVVLINSAGVVAVTNNIIGYITSGTASASLTTTFSTSGTASLAAAWPGNVSFNNSSGTLSLPVNGAPAAPTTTSLVTNGSPTEYGQPVTFTATVSGGAAGVPTGSVNFLDGATNIGSGNLTAGVATFVTSTLTTGTHTISAVYVGNTSFATSTSGNVSQVVVQAQPTISWTPSVSTITYGTPLGAAQLNATASSKYVSSVAGTFIYTPAAGAVLTAGTQTLNVTFSPTDTADFKNATGTATITVTKATPTITWTTPAPIAYGTALSGTQLNATAIGIAGALPGTFVYTPAAGTVLNAGAGQTLSVTFTPTDTTDYNNATGGTTITVGKSTPTITWPTPAAITYGTALSATQLNATANGIAGSLPGTFVYTPASGTVLTAGSGQALSVTFTPTDTTDYNNATGGTTITVNKATPTVNWTTPAPITYGTALSATQLNATATGIAGALAGAFVYTPAAGAVLAAGSQNLSVSFTPTDTTDYNNAIGGTTIIVGKSAPTITWTTPAPIVVGTPLSATQLNATATGTSGALPGSFVYTPPSGTVLAAGNNQPLSVVFTPTDTADYVTANGNTTLTVIAVTITNVSPASGTLGDPNKTITLTGTGFLANSVVNVNGTAIATTFVSATSLTAVIPASYFQTIQTLNLTVFDPTQGQTSPAVTFAVTPPIPVVVFNGPSTAQPSQQPTITFTLTNPYPVALNATLTITFAGIGGADDPAIQFATGGRTYNITIPANTTQTPVVQLQSGTDAGVITVTLALAAGGQNVTPPTVQPVVINIPQVAPSITSATLTRSGNTITVNVIGYSDTRTMNTANFHFVASGGNKINDPDFSVPATALFSTWFTTAGSQIYGSAFTYTQTFNLSSDNSVVGQVTVTLTNSAGTSSTATAQ